MTKVDADHRTSIGDQTAQGEFVVLTLTHRQRAANLLRREPEAQRRRGQGKTYSNDDMVEASPNGDAFLSNINSGNQVQVPSVFTPPGTQPTAVKLHDSAFSGGATVTLS